MSAFQTTTTSTTTARPPQSNLKRKPELLEESPRAPGLFDRLLSLFYTPTGAMDQSIISDQSDLTDPPPSSPLSSGSDLSLASKSPSLSPPSRNRLQPDEFGRLPSPPSTIPSGSASPLKPQYPIESEIHVNPDGPPPAKRRKTEPKPRTTEHLNLCDGPELSDADEKLLTHLKTVLRRKKKIVVIAGAGISVSAGSKLSTALCFCLPELALTLAICSSRFSIFEWSLCHVEKPA